jgi:hypothetical protein
MDKLTKTKHVLDSLLPMVLINIINSYYEFYELIKELDIIYNDRNDLCIIDDTIQNRYSMYKCVNIKGYRTIFDYAYPNAHTSDLKNRTYDEYRDYKYIISFKHDILLENHHSSDYMFMNLTQCCATYIRQKMSIRSMNITSFFPDKDEAIYLIDYIFHGDQLFFNTCCKSRGISTPVYVIDLRTCMCHKAKYITKLPMGKLFVSKTFIYTWNNENIYAFNLKTLTHTTINNHMFHIHHITDNYIFGQMTHDKILSVLTINSPRKIIKISPYHKLGFRENKFFVLNKIQENDDVMQLQIYTIDD